MEKDKNHKEEFLCCVVDDIITGQMSVEEFERERLNDEEREAVMESVFYGLSEQDQDA